MQVDLLSGNCLSTEFYQNPNPFLALVSHLKQPGDEDRQADGLHDVGVVVQQRLATASHPQVQHLRLVLVVEVGRVVGELVLDAGPRREGVAAAEGDTVHQVLALDVAPQSAGRERREGKTQFFRSFKLLGQCKLLLVSVVHLFIENFEY